MIFIQINSTDPMESIDSLKVDFWNCDVVTKLKMDQVYFGIDVIIIDLKMGDA